MTTTTNTETLTVKSSGLREGDVVIAEGGMRCLIDGPIGHGPSPHHESGVFYQRALVLNRDEVDPEHVPFSFTQRAEDGDEHRWTIQGNDNAYWTVERAVVRS